MKKKLFTAMLACLVCFVLTACGKNNVQNNPNAKQSDSNKPGFSTGDGTGTNNTQNGTSPNLQVVPDSLARADADISLDDLIATLGLKETDLDNAMKDVATVGDNVVGARTYRHKLLGHDSDVSYSFGNDKAIDRITVYDVSANMPIWNKELSETLKAKAVEGQKGMWEYNGSTVRTEEKDGKYIITIEKKHA